MAGARFRSAKRNLRAGACACSDVDQCPLCGGRRYDLAIKPDNPTPSRFAGRRNRAMRDQ